MPFNPINFAYIQPQGSPFLRNLVENLKEGYKAGQMPQELERQRQKEELANALSQFKLDHAPQEFQSDMATAELQRALIQANIDKARNSPTGGGASFFRTLPPDEKRRAISTAVSMGYDPLEAANLFGRGYTLQQLADEKGVDLSTVKPTYALSGTAINNLSNRKAFASEIENLESNISEPLSKVSRKIYGYSPAQVWGAVSGMDSADQQGQILAARALQPELAALRIKAAGGNVGIEAIREMQDAVMGKLHVFEGTVSPEAYESMNRYISKWLNEAIQSYNENLERGSSIRPRNNNVPSERQPKSLGEFSDSELLRMYKESR